jgi:predicted Rossmann fold flavoprotein
MTLPRPSKASLVNAMRRVAIIGAGPAGVMAGIAAATNGHSVIIFEQNEKVGKKLFLTGKGRCNITNDADIEDFFLSIPRNHKFLYSALYSFSNYSLVEYLNSCGLKTKVERGGRVFPVSDKSSDVIKALKKGLAACGAKVLLNTKVTGIEKSGEYFLVKTDKKTSHFDVVIFATGGCSYQSTGSDGVFFNIVKSLGHTVTDLQASLIGLNTKSSNAAIAGLTLKNIGARFFNDGKQVYTEQGELLFTHQGISGPLALSASAFFDDKNMKDAHVLLDLKPALDEQKLDDRLIRDISEKANKDFVNLMRGLLPISLIEPFCEKLSFDSRLKANMVTKQNRSEIIMVLKNYRIDIASKGELNQAIITRGGVNVNEINPSTMQSKLIEGLFFAGEMIDVDALTGGYNLQIAFSTGYLAGLSI